MVPRHVGAVELGTFLLEHVPTAVPEDKPLECGAATLVYRFMEQREGLDPNNFGEFSIFLKFAKRSELDRLVREGYLRAEGSNLLPLYTRTDKKHVN